MHLIRDKNDEKLRSQLENQQQLKQSFIPNTHPDNHHCET